MIFFSECQCNEDGSVDTSCDDGSGKCSCNPNIVGDKCTQCAIEHFAFPTCDGKYYCQGVPRGVGGERWTCNPRVSGLIPAEGKLLQQQP